MNFEGLFQQRLETLHREDRYRVFAVLKRRRGFANGLRVDNLAKARALMAVPTPETAAEGAAATPGPCCGGRMIVIETFEAGCQPQHRPTTSVGAIRIDTS